MLENVELKNTFAKSTIFSKIELLVAVCFEQREDDKRS